MAEALAIGLAGLATVRSSHGPKAGCLSSWRVSQSASHQRHAVFFTSGVLCPTTSASAQEPPPLNAYLCKARGARKIDADFSRSRAFHLVMTPPEEVQRVAAHLDETLKIKRVAPGHCTSEFGFKVLMERFKDRFDPAGLGVH